VIAFSLEETTENIKRFQREVMTSASLIHPSIVKLIDAGHEENYLYLANDLMAGGALSKQVRKKLPTLAQISRNLERIAAALDYAHQRGIIHRDVKASNILLDANGDAYLGDFGIARIVGNATHLTRTGLILGTPAYMAPELWRSNQADQRSDVYALGIVLFEMICGYLPFQSPNFYSLMNMHLNEEMPSAHNARSDLPADIDTVLNKALAKDPATRFYTAGELSKAFKALIDEAPKSEKPTT
jgi:serine/threonine protein kinase